MATPVLVEIIAYAPTAYYHCKHCEIAWREAGVSNRMHDEQVDSSLPTELALEYQSISDWIHEVFRRYCDQVAVKVIDAASLEGVISTLRYRVHRFPAIIVGREARFSGDVTQALARASVELDRRLAAGVAPGV